MAEIPSLGNFPPRALLTGAGFTRNWGGYLASEVWDRLLGKVQANAPLVRCLHQHFGNFESALDEARESLDPEDIRVLEDAVVEVFRDQQRNITVSHQHLLRPFFSAFGAGHQGGDQSFDTGYFFTLNQDCFVEAVRAMEDFRSRQVPIAPGVRDLVEKVPAPQLERVLVPPDPALTLSGNLNYVKLHGSYHWQGQGRRMLVVGANKARQIEGFELLSQYFDIFQRVLCQDGMRLVIVGYSFSDSHVNEVIRRAIEENGLTLCIADAVGAAHLRKSLSEREHGAEIVGAIRGFSSAPPLSEVFSDRGEQERHRIYREFLQLARPYPS